jgi:hypothetical protein
MGARVVTVNDVLEGHVALDIQCLDRIYLNAYVPKLQSSAQVVAFLSDHLGYPFPSPALFNQIGQRFRRAVASFAEAMQPVNDLDRHQNLQEGLTERLSLIAGRSSTTAGSRRRRRPSPPWRRRSGWPGGCGPSSFLGAPTPRFCGIARRSWCGARSSTPCSRRRRAWPRACASSADPCSTRASW